MKTKSGALIWIGTALCCCLLSACEPSVGKVIERVEMASPDGSTVITAVLYAEGTWGNPADGEHLHIFCRSTYLTKIDMGFPDGKRIGNAYFPGKLVSIPKERITVFSNKIIYGTISLDFFITEDGCKTRKLWEGTEEFYRKVKKYPNGEIINPDISFFKSANLCPDGLIVLSVDESYLIDARELWAVSTDGAGSWSYVTTRPKC